MHCRVIQPRAHGSLHLAAVYVLVWLAAYLGTYLGQGAYVGEARTHHASADTDVPDTMRWKASRPAAALSAPPARCMCAAAGGDGVLAAALAAWR